MQKILLVRYTIIVIFILVISFSSWLLLHTKKQQPRKLHTIADLYKSSKYEELKHLLKKRIARDPYNPSLYRYLWRAYLYSDEPELAIDVLKRMKKIFNNPVDVNFGLCFTYYDMEHFAKALYYCKNLLKLNSHSIPVYRRLINIYVKHFGVHQAIIYLNSVKEHIDGDDYIVLLSEIYKLSGQHDKLIRLLEKARYKYPKTHLFSYLLGIEYFAKSKCTKAIKFLDKFLSDLNKDDINFDLKYEREDALLKLGHCYEVKHLLLGANDVYKKLACIYAKEGKFALSNKMIKRIAVLKLMKDRQFVSQEKFLKEFTKVQDFVKEQCAFKESL